MTDAFSDQHVAVDLELAPEGLSRGALGWVDAIHEAAQHAGLEGSATLDRQELYLASSAALRTYTWAPHLNPPEDPPRSYSPLGELFTNFGVFESLSFYTGWSIKEFNELTRRQFWEVVAFEARDGRAVCSMGLGGALEPALITGAQGAFPDRQVTLWRAGATAGERVALHAVGNAQGDSEDFRNWLVVVRPGMPRETTTRNRQRVDVLRWAANHGRGAREFFHETRANYDAGLTGWTTFRALLEQPTLRDEEREGFARYALGHLDELQRGRAAAAARLPGWADELEEGRGVVVHDLSAARAALRDAADAYAGVAVELAGVDALTPEALRDPAQRADLAAQHARAAQHEERAVQALQRAMEQVPRIF